MKRIVYSLLLICVGMFAQNVQSQVVPNGYRQQIQHEMTRFADSINDDFVRYLEHLWAEYQLFSGEPSPRSIKPVEQPQLDTLDDADTIKIDSQISFGHFTEIHEVTTEDFHPYVSVGAQLKREYTLQFYGRELTIALPEKVAEITLAGIRERHVARFWEKLAEFRADQCVASLQQQRRNLYLGDWGFFDLIRQFSAIVYPNQPNEQSVFSVFILNSMRFDARVGRMDDNLVTLVNTGSRLYDIPYVEIDTVRYYAFGNLSKKGRIYSYERQMKSADRQVDVHLANSPRLGGALSSHAFSATVLNRKVSIRVNQPLMDFYAHYPQTELSIYANAAVEEAFAAAIEREFRPFVDKQSPLTALNNLLGFMQQGFKYQTDLNQFHCEKNFFCEENFYYPANDCEDRAVLFAKMVRILLGYDVVLLEYGDHVATAVNVPDQKIDGQHLDLQGKRYMVCDPTCLGATVGELNRKYRQKEANIIQCFR